MKLSLLVLLAVGLSVEATKIRPRTRFPAGMLKDDKYLPLLSQRIVGGEQASPGEIPFQISFQDTYFGNFHFCGGILHDPLHVITAAHCCVGQDIADLRVVAGDHDLSTENEGEQDSSIKEIIIHEDYDSAALTNDICILVLDNALQIKPDQGLGSVDRVAMPTRNDDFPTGTKAVVSGWGTTSSGGSSPDVLRRVDVFVDSYETCYAAYGDMYQESAHIGASDDGKDSCQGDSGGPMTCLDAQSRSKLCGIVSWGRGCALPDYPGIYTRVTSYIQWINTHLQ